MAAPTDDWLRFNASEYTLNGKTYRNLEAQVLKNMRDIAELQEGGGSEEIFVATYNTTPYADITAALTAGKVVFCRYTILTSSFWLRLVASMDNKYFFSGISSLTDDASGEVIYQATVNSSNSWAVGALTPGSQIAQDFFTLVDSVESNDDGFAVLYNETEGGYQPEIDIPLEGSETVIVDVSEDGDKIIFDLDQDVKNTLSRALVIPISTLTEKMLVGVDTGNTEILLKIGDGLELAGSTSPYTLRATGGGGLTWKTQLAQAANWSGTGPYSLVLADPAVSTTSKIVFAPAPESMAEAISCKVYASVIGYRSITLTAETKPTNDLRFYYIIG